MIYRALFCSVITLLGSCAAYKIPIKPGDPTANIVFVDPRNAKHVRLLYPAHSKIYLLDEVGCIRIGLVAGIGNFNSYNTRLTVPAGKKLFFEWESSAPALGASWKCNVISGFAPEVGRTYEARFDMDIANQICSSEFFELVHTKGASTTAVRLRALRKSAHDCPSNAK